MNIAGGAERQKTEKEHGGDKRRAERERKKRGHRNFFLPFGGKEGRKDGWMDGRKEGKKIGGGGRS